MSPAQAQALLQQALQHHHAERFQPAALLYAELRKALPRNFDAHHLGGAAALQQGRADAAAPLLQRAIQLRPTSATTHMCLGLAYAQLGHRLEAETALKKSLALDPANFEAWHHLAAIEVSQDHLDEAVRCYRRSIQLNPKFGDALTALGSVLQALGQSDEALELHTRALVLHPGHPRARFLRAQCLLARHAVPEALRDFDEHLRRYPGDLEARSHRLFLLHYLPALSPRQLFEEHREFGRRATKSGSAPPRFLNAEQPEKKLRVAFISPDLRTHSVAYFLEPILQYLDRSEFEVVLYHDHFRTDAVSERLRSLAVLWRNFVGQSNPSVETTLRADAPDILIELAGHTGLNRLPLLAKRVAPIQITYLGYPDTTGVPAIDYRLTDAQADPPEENGAFATERLIRFSDTAWSYLPPDIDLPPAPASADGRPVTFGSFNSLGKINPTLLAMWAELLRRVPEARLVLKSFGLTETLLLPRLREAGIDPARVDLLQPTAPHAVAEHLASYARVDIALDPFPYHGTTTTCEALWMGVPVVSLRGDRHASRVGASLLHAVGHPEWLAATAAEYIAIAQGLAADPGRRSALRQTLRGEMERSSLRDGPGQALRFGQALRECWRVHCRAGAPSRQTATA